MLSAVTVGAVAVGATMGLVPSAAAEPSSGRPLVVDIVGGSYMAGDGIADRYLDPVDLRHRSLASPALQALSRVASENPGLQIDANLVASSGAATADYFNTQKGVGARGEDVVVNTAQHDQIRPNAQIVIVGFGGNDAHLAEVLAMAKPSNSSTPGDLHVKIKNFGGLLDTSAPDQTYLDQASSSPLGDAPTLVSRMLQVLGGISVRAPHARIIVTNYPLAVDPDDPRSTALIKKRDLATVQKFLLDLNETIERAVRICACADVVDLTNALDGHEVYTADSAYTEPASGQPHTKAVQPNDEGAALMADPLAKGLATLLGIRLPAAGNGRVTVPENIIARSGESDVDGDLVPDFQDESAQDPNNHRRKAPHHDRPPRRSTDWGSTKDARLPGLGAVVDLGTKEKETRQGGIIPAPILPSPAPAPRREADPDRKPSRADDEPEATPVPARTPRSTEDSGSDTTDRIEEVPAAGEPAEENAAVTDIPVDENDEAEEEIRSEEPVADSPAGETSWVADGTAPDGSAIDIPAEEVVPEAADETAPEEPATDTPAELTDWFAEEATSEVADEIAREETVADSPTEEIDEVASEAPANEEEPGRVEVEPSRPEVPVEATDGQQVCILIYPAPAGCGGSEPEGSLS